MDKARLIRNMKSLLSLFLFLFNFVFFFFFFCSILVNIDVIYFIYFYVIYACLVYLTASCTLPNLVRRMIVVFS